MNNWLNLKVPTDGTPAQKERQLAAQAADMTKEELSQAVAKLTLEAQQAEARSGGYIVGGAGAGFLFGEALNQGFKSWGESNLPLAGIVREYYPYLRMVPAGLLSILLLLVGRKLDNRATVLSFAAGVGLTVPVLVRLVDYMQHKGDLSAEQETQLQARAAKLEARVQELEAQLKKGG